MFKFNRDKRFGGALLTKQNDNRETRYFTPSQKGLNERGPRSKGLSARETLVLLKTSKFNFDVSDLFLE